MPFSSAQIRIVVLSICCCGVLLIPGRLEAKPLSSSGLSETQFNVRGYIVEGRMLPPTNFLAGIFSRCSGPHLRLQDLVRAATEVQSEFGDHGYRGLSVVVGLQRLAQGIVVLDVFRGAIPQIVVSGQRYVISSNGVVTADSTASESMPSAAHPTVAKTAPDNGPRFIVKKYLVSGNSLLAPQTLGAAISNAPGAFGTNVSFSGIEGALEKLQQAYKERGYVTVSVGLPQQRLTNATVRVRVTEGRLAQIRVVGNRYFSSNNVVRALPSLRTNTVLNGLIFQAELNRANANQDRQIYPVLGPGSKPGTSELTLRVKDRLPLHGKLELNNQSSPGTPDLRLNSSFIYNNLWQREHSLGVQYNFSPEILKGGNQWAFYDRPLVSIYSAFYRMPLGDPQSIGKEVAGQPGSFGYSEATHQFKLPPPSGQPELSLYASRATIDTGVQNLYHSVIFDIPGVRQVSREDDQQDLTINEAAGMRLSQPLRGTESLSSTISEGLDFKRYVLSDFKTNVFHFTEVAYDANGNPLPPIVSSVNSTVPVTRHRLNYLPLSLDYSATWRRGRWTVTSGFGISGNLWHSGSAATVQNITGSTNSSGHWLAVTPSVSANLMDFTNWTLSLQANGQWASEPLINNEQFGAGGVGSVRGYREGEVFGDEGWHVSLEQQTPAHLVGFIGGRLPMTVRGSVYMDGAEVFLLDPQGRPDHVALWGAGLGGIISLGAYWEARFLFSVPLLAAHTTRAYQPFFNFSLTAQF